MAYYELEPFGERRADLRIGLMTAHLMGALVGTEGQEFRALDFMPDLGDEPEQESDEDDEGWAKPRKSVEYMRAVFESAIRAAERRKQKAAVDGSASSAVEVDNGNAG